MQTRDRNRLRAGRGRASQDQYEIVTPQCRSIQPAGPDRSAAVRILRHRRCGPLSMMTVRGENVSATRLFCSTRMIDIALSARSFAIHADQGLDQHRRQAFGRLVHQQDGRDWSATRARSPASAARRRRADCPYCRAVPASRGNSWKTRSSVQCPGRARDVEIFAHRQRRKNLALLRHEPDAGQRAADSSACR